MAKWYVKEVSQLTGVSVRTLHHYDEIGLLKPSLRHPQNQYRLYSEADLLKLQQIIALKFFGFELSQIKALLQEKNNLKEQLAAQATLLQKKAQTLLEASHTLTALISECNFDRSIPWKKIIEMIEVYHMTQKLERTWAANIFNAEELKEFIAFEQALKTESSRKDKEVFKQAWGQLVQEIEENVNEDPTSSTGVALGKRCMELMNDLYGEKYAHLRTKIWKEGFKKGRVDGNYGLSPKAVTWLDKAMDTYYRQRIYAILNEVEKNPEKALQAWNHLLNEMYGKDENSKQALRKAALADQKVSQAAKAWLKDL